jgi:hypothetical protein
VVPPPAPDEHAEHGKPDEHRAAIGSFRFVFDSDLWELSDNSDGIHWYTEGSPSSESTDPPLTTDRALGHVHPVDRDRAIAKLLEARNRPSPYSFQHLLIDASGHQRVVIVLVNPMRDATGTVIGLQGFYVERDGQVDAEILTLQAMTDQANEIHHREKIDKAKGMLMAIYGLSGEAALRLLRGSSQLSNAKLHVLAEALIAELTELAQSSDPSLTGGLPTNPPGGPDPNNAF